MLSVLVLVMACGPSAPARAGWEHAPICADTRLPANESAVWEYGMVYTLETLYPAEFSCPAGAAVVIHFLNLSPKTVSLRFGKTHPLETIAPQGYRRLDLGKQTAGEHEFFLEFPETKEECTHHCAYYVPGQMRCLVRATTWPETEFVYRAAVMLRGTEVLPGVTRLPAGRFCELYVADSGSPAKSWQSTGYTFRTKPREITLTEFARPKGTTITGILDSKAKIIIR